MPCWRKVLVLGSWFWYLFKSNEITQSIDISKLPKGFLATSINLQSTFLVSKSIPQTSLGNLSKLSAKVQLLDSHSRNNNFSMDRIACWQCCSVSPRKGQLQKPLVHPQLHPLSRKTCHSLDVWKMECLDGMSSIWSCEALRTLAEGQESRFSLHQQVLFRRGRQNRRFSVLDGDQLHWDQYHWTRLDCFKDPATVCLEKHPFCHHSNFISRGVIPDKFQTGPNQESSSENGLYTCYNSCFAASLWWSPNKTTKRFSHDFFRNAWLAKSNNLPGASLAKLPIFSECAANTHPENSLSTLGHWSPVLQIVEGRIGPGTIYNHDLRKIILCTCQWRFLYAECLQESIGQLPAEH